MPMSELTMGKTHEALKEAEKLFNNGVKDVISYDLEKLKRVAEKYFSNHSARLKTISGFKALGIADSSLNLLAGRDESDVFERDHPRSIIASGIDLSSMVSNLKPTGIGKMATVHTSEVIVQIFSCACGLSKPVFVIGVSEADGNWLFLKHEIEKMNAHLLDCFQ
jgi:hypothetical protein